LIRIEKTSAKFHNFQELRLAGQKKNVHLLSQNDIKMMHPKPGKVLTPILNHFESFLHYFQSMLKNFSGHGLVLV